MKEDPLPLLDNHFPTSVCRAFEQAGTPIIFFLVRWVLWLWWEKTMMQLWWKNGCWMEYVG
jgi:hypothetical protein